MTIIVGDYTSFEKNFIAAAYYTSNLLNLERVTVQQIQQHFLMDWERRWILNALKQLREANWSRERLHNGTIGEQYVRLTPSGLKEAERLISANEVTLKRITEPEAKSAEPEEESLNVDTIDSSAWTGVARRLERNQAAVEEIERRIEEIDHLVEDAGLTDSEKSRAKAISQALKSLIASPEPEWRVIVTLLNSPNLLAVLNVANIAQIALKLIFGIG